jgi:hypothetical protein
LLASFRLRRKLKAKFESFQPSFKAKQNLSKKKLFHHSKARKKSKYGDSKIWESLPEAPSSLAYKYTYSSKINHQ